jgi:hypothetical protein
MQRCSAGALLLAACCTLQSLIARLQRTRYSSAEFADKEAATAAMRAAVGALPDYPAGLDTTLANWWNVFDAFNVARSGP